MADGAPGCPGALKAVGNELAGPCEDLFSMPGMVNITLWGGDPRGTSMSPCRDPSLILQPCPEITCHFPGPCTVAWLVLYL